jgi:uncharacterized protein (DUF433 family)
MDCWSDCPLVERIPGKLGGQPVIKGTRLRAETIVSNYEAGSSIEEIQEDYRRLSRDTIISFISYYQSHAPQPR